jgi:hypothetical protein
MDDYISREAAIACLYSTMESYYIKRNIMDLPAADVLPVELIRERIHDALQLLDEINEECGLSRDDYRDLRDTIEGIQLPDLETIMRGYNTK